MDITLKNIRATCPASKSDFDRVMNPYAYYLARPLSFYLTLPLLKLNVTANQVTVASFLFAASSSFLIFLPEPWNIAAVLAFATTWLILDCVDGNIARFHRKAGYPVGGGAGEFLDALGYYLLISVFYIPLGLYLDDGSGLYTAAGALASTFGVLARLVHQKYLNCGGESSDLAALSVPRIIIFNLYNQSSSNLPFFALAFAFGFGRFYLLTMLLISIVVLLGFSYKHYKSLEACRKIS